MDLTETINQVGLPLIAALVPLAIAAFKRALPLVPKWVLPVLAPIIGAAGELALAALAGVEGSGMAGAFAGLAGVGVRELVDQAKRVVTEPR